MGREANFSELRESIRQGQAKIAQGLKTGQMRSDRDKDTRVPVPRLDPAHELLGKKPTLTEKTAIFEPRKKDKVRFALPKLPTLPHIRIRLPRLPRVSLPPMRPMLFGVAAIIAVAMVVLVVFWIGKALIGSRDAQPPVTDAGTVQPVIEPRPADVRPVVQERPMVPVQREAVVTPRPTPTPEPARPAPATSTGNNVIVIQYITSSRENELRSVQDFFGRNGIVTEIIQRGSGSYLVTRDRFENPNRSGSDGYEMLIKIRRVGKRYAADTGDSKFGTEPFQDAYGMVIR
jgi:hypothetical protein